MVIGFFFSYSVKDGNNTVINASLLGAKILSYSYKYTKNEEHFKASKKSCITACDYKKKMARGFTGFYPYNLG